MLGDSDVKLADGFFGVVWSIKGDLDWFSKEFGMMKYRENADPCDWCPCSKIGHPSNWPHCFDATSQWKTAIRTRDQWRAWKGASMHRLFTVFSFLSVENMEPDELHIFHLGVSGYCWGSILYLLVYVLLVGSPHDNLNRV